MKPNGMRVRTYAVLQRAVEEGAMLGVSHAFKHTDHPTQEAITTQVEVDVMNAICEWFEFEESAL